MGGRKEGWEVEHSFEYSFPQGFHRWLTTQETGRNGLEKSDWSFVITDDFNLLESVQMRKAELSWSKLLSHLSIGVVSRELFEEVSLSSTR